MPMILKNHTRKIRTAALRAKSKKPLAARIKERKQGSATFTAVKNMRRVR